MWQSLEIFNIFNAITLNPVFCKTKTFSETLEYHILVKSAAIGSWTFPYKTALSKVNVKTNRMGSTKWTYHKAHSFATNYFSLLKI